MEKSTKFTRVFFYNLSGYDGHLIIQDLASRQTTYKKLTEQPKNSKTYISIQFDKLRFLDSYKFLLQGLADVVKSLKDEDFIITKKYFKDPEQFKFV